MAKRIMIKRTSVFTLVAALAVAAASAQETNHEPVDSGSWWQKRQERLSEHLYNANELNFDVFGSYLHQEGEFHDLFETDIDKGGLWGGGAGLSYFFLRNVGIGTDFNVSDHDGGSWDFDYWVGNIYLRLPIGETPFSPYIYGGGGRGITPIWQWEYGGGVGLEVRFSHNFGIFSDARFLWADKTTGLNSLGIRAGFRFAF
jgi:hypothetical protein